ncbi:Schizosaccharomyces pombe specific protein [Schizosaccharomyces pombe]|uniref:Uncharacterized protein C20G4.09 n=1 Tax=Schizosaccharomyces pombe (strain 972 / ATCC 24843) TaxID=284812 RepID=YE39_SCHPO|nr:RecName: Full=Uncharacterized protein C20G4.09 [Schizosaccharomyces pombe 972h-]CBA11507.1 sequence orphan [Schizosaccharomyces pombe]|eukprot:NP_001343082.1 uncharacterized protein SPAC20G4.09 [Schizosaccharomyces pombe]
MTLIKYKRKNIQFYKKIIANGYAK